MTVHRYHIAFLIALCSLNVFAQEAIEEEFQPELLVSFVTTTALLPSSKSEVYVFVPSYGVDLAYQLNPKWEVGLFADIELLDYTVETNDNVTIERAYPLILSVVGIYKPFEKWAFIIGPGYEFETNKNFYIGRLGVEYELAVTRPDWLISFGVTYENKELEYHVWEFGWTIGKLFSIHNR